MLIRCNSLALVLTVALTLLVGLSGVAPGSQARAVAPPKPTPADIEAQEKAAEAAQKKAMEAQKNQAMEALKAQEAEALKGAFILLASAHEHYEGHKGKAMHEVEEALKILDHHAMKKVRERLDSMEHLHKFFGETFWDTLGFEALNRQAISDAHVIRAGELLKHLLPTLDPNKQPKIHAHVNNAIKEIAAATAKDNADNIIKGKEAQLLTLAYILVASTDKDYGGSREKARQEIADACRILEVDILKSGTVAQKIRALQTAQADALAKGKNEANPGTTEPQSLSDAQLFMADSVIRILLVNLDKNKQARVLEHVGRAHREIARALMVN